jgi:hypothetical protein
MPLAFSPWDLALLAVVTAMGTLLAYLPHPRWKAFLLSLPFPFTLANLSLGEPPGPSHALGLWTFLLFVHLVPAGPAVFWAVLGAAIAAGVVLLLLLPHRLEPAHRSPLPAGVKLAAVAGVVAVLVLLKRTLGGFMTMFPMVATVAAYEARHSLWTLGRQVPVVLVTMGPMIAAMWLLQHLGGASMAFSLLGGWAVFLAILVPVTWTQWRRANKTSSEAEMC